MVGLRVEGDGGARRHHVERVQGVEAEVGDRHLARGDEGGGLGEQAKDDQRSAHQLDRAGDHQHRRQGAGHHGGGEVEQLHAAVLHEHQPRDDTQKRQ